MLGLKFSAQVGYDIITVFHDGATGLIPGLRARPTGNWVVAWAYDSNTVSCGSEVPVLHSRQLIPIIDSTLNLLSNLRKFQSPIQFH